jgi:hypothetical protein
MHLFLPRDAVRGVYEAAFQYYLARPADTVRMEILDERGRVIRTLTGVKDTAAKDTAAASRDSAAAKRAGSPKDSLATRGTAIDSVAASARTASDTCEGGRRRRPERTPSAKAGLNKFVWDLRYPGATVFECMVIWGASPQLGPVAPPGRYRVRLTANGRTETQPFMIRRDPRLTEFTDADLQAQFALATRIRDLTSAANDAVIRIRTLERQLADRRAQWSDAPQLAAAADSLRAHASAIEENLYQVRNRSGQDPLNFPIRLNNRLAALQRSVETGDARPTAGAYVVVRELSAELDRELGHLRDLLGGELSTLNARLAERKLEPLKVPAQASP